MEIKKLNAARGWIWVKQGYQLIMRNPLMSITLALCCALAMFVVLQIPLFAYCSLPIIFSGAVRY